MMQAKFFEIRDRGTFIPVIAINIYSYAHSPISKKHIAKERDKHRYLLRSVGYGLDTEYQLIIMRLVDCKAANDCYDWQDRTMKTAHNYIDENWRQLADGAVIDVEYILGETKEPKKSQQQETFGS